MFYGLTQLMSLPVLWADPIIKFTNVLCADSLNEFTSFMG